MLIRISLRSSLMFVPVLSFLAAATVLSGCVAPLLPPRWSNMDPTDPTAPAIGELPHRLTLIAETKRYIDSSVGREVTQMKHGMPGMGSAGMPSMDHSKMAGMKSDDDMTGMDHDKMPGKMPQTDSKGETQSGPSSANTVINEMKKTEDEMKKMSDELKARSDAMKQSQ